MTDLTRSFRVPDDLWQAAMEKAADTDQKVSDVLRSALHDFTTCSDCTCELCGEHALSVDDLEQLDEPAPETAAIWGYGTFDTTANPDVQALIDRATELLAVGAVGVSIATDLDPADLPADPNEVTDEDIQAAHIRPRHVAIVDTAAFSGCYLGLEDDGTLAGPIVMEGTPTGDIRGLPLNSLTWDDNLLPIPIIFDMAEGDHTGTVVGHIDRLERVNQPAAEDVAPIVASAHAWPAKALAEPTPGPMRFEEIDGYTRYSGTIVPTGVCHRGRGGCYTYRGASLDYFHSGAKIPLDDGSYARVGRIVAGGLHADSEVIGGKFLDYEEALARTDDARRGVAMGRCFDSPKGLLFSGVLLPGVTPDDVAPFAPSVELWPNKRGKLELKTALLVNEPAWPVAASVGDGSLLVVNDEPVQVEDEPDLEPALVHLAERITQLEHAVAPMLAAHLAATVE